MDRRRQAEKNITERCKGRRKKWKTHAKINIRGMMKRITEERMTAKTNIHIRGGAVAGAWDGLKVVSHVRYPQ